METFVSGRWHYSSLARRQSNTACLDTLSPYSSTPLLEYNRARLELINIDLVHSCLILVSRDFTSNVRRGHSSAHIQRVPYVIGSHNYTRYDIIDKNQESSQLGLALKDLGEHNS